MNNQRLFVLMLSVFGLSACNTLEGGGRAVNDSGAGYYDPYQQADLPYVPSAATYSYESTIDYQSPPIEEHVVTVPDTYHVGLTHSPVSHQTRDKSWVSSQNPQAFTIEISSSAKASEVANQLMKVPKKEHMAEVQVHQNGGSQYEGVYGSYPSYDAAKQALETLPESIKNQARVKSWADLQRELD